MITFYLIGSLVSAVCFLLGEKWEEDKLELIPNQKILMLLIAMSLSWFGLIGTIVFGFEETRRKNDKDTN